MAAAAAAAGAGAHLWEGLEGCELHGIRLYLDSAAAARWRQAGGAGGGGGGPLPLPFTHLLSVSAFAMDKPYKDSTKYGAGLLRLVEAARRHLPSFLLRVYLDRSVLPSVLHGGGRDAEATYWGDAVERLRGADNVAITWFECPALLSPSERAHVDLYGTMLRFLPLFDTAGSALPPWAQSPPDGAVVFVTDADYNNLVSDHSYVHVAQWFAAATEHACAAGAPAPAAAALPTLVSASTAASAASRHIPTVALPPFIACCIATRTRLPLAWLTDFLTDATRPTSLLLQRYVDDLADTRKPSFSLRWRRVADQSSRFPFGIDEYFLTVVLKLRALAAPRVQRWLFFIFPNFYVVNKTVGMVAAALAASPALIGNPSVAELLLINARLAGDSGAAGAIAGAAAAAASAIAARWPLRDWAKEWAQRSIDRLRLNSEFCGDFRELAGDVGPLTIHAFSRLCALALDAIAGGSLPHTLEDVEFFTQALAHHTAFPGRVVVAATFEVGAGTTRAVRTEHAGGVRGLHEFLPGAPVCAAEAAAAAAAPPGRRGASARVAHPPPLDSANQLWPAGVDRGASWWDLGVVIPSAAPSTAPDGAAAAAGAGGGSYASASAVATPASGWVRATSKSTGQSYWYNTATHASSWSVPPEVTAASGAAIGGAKRSRSEYDATGSS